MPRGLAADICHAAFGQGSCHPVLGAAGTELGHANAFLGTGHSTRIRALSSFEEFLLDARLREDSSGDDMHMLGPHVAASSNEAAHAQVSAYGQHAPDPGDGQLRGTVEEVVIVHGHHRHRLPRPGDAAVADHDSGFGDGRRVVIVHGDRHRLPRADAADGHWQHAVHERFRQYDPLMPADGIVLRRRARPLGPQARLKPPEDVDMQEPTEAPRPEEPSEDLQPLVVSGAALAVCAQVYMWANTFVVLFKPPRRAAALPTALRRGGAAAADTAAGVPAAALG